MEIGFSGKTVIITGGARGIGRSVAEEVAKTGGHVVIADINEEEALRAKEEIGSSSVSVYKVNLEDTKQTAHVFEQIVREKKKIDVLINNAGVISTAPFELIEKADWDRVIAINLSSVFVTCQIVFRHMKEQGGGRIVNISSSAAKRGGGLLGTSAYAASKAGLIGLTKAIAREGAAFGISCNAVCPSWTKTLMTAGIEGEVAERLKKTIPLGRPAEPLEIAGMILYIASDLASFVTGEIRDIDGGVTMDG